MAAPKSVVLIMAGGSGTRFWPASRPEKPKQYLALAGERSLIQSTVDRLAPTFSEKDIVICSTASQRELIQKQLPGIKRLILEPQGKNTAACIALSAITLLHEGASEDTIMITLAADHFIEKVDAFRKLLTEASQFASQHSALITFGIVPSHAHTGYGYIERADAKDPRGSLFPVNKFVEKPDREKAQSYLASGKFYWNSGMFVWSLGTIKKAYQTHLPEMWSALSEAVSKNKVAAVYATLPSIPVDIGIMEKASDVYVMPSEIGWSDVGSWSAVYELEKPDASRNVIKGPQTIAIDTRNCLVFGDRKFQIGLIGLENVMVVVDGDRILICRNDRDQAVREVQKHFEK